MRSLFLTLLLFPILCCAQVDSVLTEISKNVSFEKDRSNSSKYKQDEDASFQFSINNDTLHIDSEKTQRAINQMDGSVYDVNTSLDYWIPISEIGKIKIKTNKLFYDSSCDTCYVELGAFIISEGNCEKPYLTQSSYGKKRHTGFVHLSLPRITDLPHFKELAEYIRRFNSKIEIVFE